MTGGFELQAWHVSLFAAAAILIIEVIVWTVLRLRPRSQPVDEQERLSNKRLRTGGLILLAIVAVVMAVAALGPNLADQLAGVTAAALAGVGVWLAYRSHQETVRLAAEIRAAARTSSADRQPPPAEAELITQPGPAAPPDDR